MISLRQLRLCAFAATHEIKSAMAISDGQIALTSYAHDAKIGECIVEDFCESSMQSVMEILGY